MAVKAFRIKKIISFEIEYHNINVQRKLRVGYLFTVLSPIPYIRYLIRLVASPAFGINKWSREVTKIPSSSVWPNEINKYRLTLI